MFSFGVLRRRGAAIERVADADLAGQPAAEVRASSGLGGETIWRDTGWRKTGKSFFAGTA